MKIPTLYIGLPLLWLACQKFKWKFLLNYRLLIFAFIILFGTFLWYYHAHQLYVNGGSTFNIWEVGTDKWGNLNLLYSWSFYTNVFYSTIAERLLTLVATNLFIIGLFVKKEFKYEKVFDIWLIALIIYIIIVAQGNLTHDYYQLPFVLPAVVFIGKIIGKYSFNDLKYLKEQKIIPILLTISLIFLMCLSYIKASEQFIKENLNQTYFALASDIKKTTLKDDLIITVCDGNPIYLYTADRKGWISAPNQFDEKYLNDRIKEGAKILTGDKKWINTDKSKELFLEAVNHYKVIEDNDRFFIIDLTQKKTLNKTF